MHILSYPVAVKANALLDPSVCLCSNYIVISLATCLAEQSEGNSDEENQSVMAAPADGKCLIFLFTNQPSPFILSLTFHSYLMESLVTHWPFHMLHQTLSNSAETSKKNDTLSMYDGTTEDELDMENQHASTHCKY